MDVTLESDATLILIENKLAPSAKRDGQLLRYYIAATRMWPDKRVIAIYLGPRGDLGTSEIDLVEHSRHYTSRSSRSVRDATKSP